MIKIYITSHLITILCLQDSGKSGSCNTDDELEGAYNIMSSTIDNIDVDHVFFDVGYFGNLSMASNIANAWKIKRDRATVGSPDVWKHADVWKDILTNFNADAGLSE